MVGKISSSSDSGRPSVETRFAMNLFGDNEGSRGTTDTILGTWPFRLALLSYQNKGTYYHHYWSRRTWYPLLHSFSSTPVSEPGHWFWLSWNLQKRSWRACEMQRVSRFYLYISFVRRRGRDKLPFCAALREPLEEWRDLNPLLFYTSASVHILDRLAYLFEGCSMMMSPCHGVWLLNR